MREVLRSVCALDCPDACAILVTIEDGKAIRLRGDPEHPVTRGFLCGKVARYLEREYSPERLLYPQKRTGSKGEGRFTRIGWEEALDEIAERLKALAAEHGPEAILPYSYAGTMGYLNGKGMDRRFFHRLGASRLDRTICSSTGATALKQTLGYTYGTDPEQFPNAKLIIAWGANVLGTNVHLWPFIVEARRKGARFYTIDPVRNRTGRASDRHFFINPGSDSALALALMHVIVAEKLHDAEYAGRYTAGFEALAARVRDYPPQRGAALTGLAAEEIVSLAREYATTKPAVIRLNYGTQRSERGGLSVRAVSLLPALTGAWRQPGGGFLLTTSGAFEFNREALERPNLQRVSPLGREARLINMTELGKALLETRDPAIHALVVYNSNPAAIAPNQNLVLQGLAREDLFTVALEQFQTDTADYADIVLPVTTFLEHTDIYSAYGHYYAQLARPALAAPGQARSNVEIFRALAARMSFEEPCFRDSEDDMIRALLDSPHPFLEGVSLDRLEREHWVRLNVPSPFLPFVDGGFGTPSGKCEFGAETLDYAPPEESRLGRAELRARYPLELISPKNDSSMNSSLGNGREVDEETSRLSMDAEDAAFRGISSGDRVRVFNGRGTCVLIAQVDSEVRQGVVRATSVRWNKRAPDRRNVNVLTSDRLTDMGGGPVFYSCLVQVEKCGD